MVHQGRDLRIGIDLDEARTELVALADIDQPGVVFGIAVTGGQQFLEQDGDLLAIGRAQRIELQRMLADLQCLFTGRTRHRPVDIGELPAIALVPGPDLGRHIA